MTKIDHPEPHPSRLPPHVISRDRGSSPSAYRTEGRAGARTCLGSPWGQQWMEAADAGPGVNWEEDGGEGLQFQRRGAV